ncbi:MAG: hypothetical protein Q8R15_02625 [Candidatus Micrarchaeota archaeon]|nr:hypothetical protein [Candidatus Micrarchaeota archaeon]
MEENNVSPHQNFYTKLREIHFSGLEIILPAVISILAIWAGVSFLVIIPIFLFALLGFLFLTLFGIINSLERTVFMIPTGFAITGAALFLSQFISAALDPLMVFFAVLILILLTVLVVKPKELAIFQRTSCLDIGFVIVLIILAFTVAMPSFFPVGIASNLPLVGSNDITGNLIQVQYMVESHSQFVAPEIHGGKSGALMAWNPLSFSIPATFTLLSFGGIGGFQAKYLMLIFELIFFALGIYVLFSEINRKLGFLGALAVTLPPIPLLFFWPQIVGAWRLTDSFLFLPGALFTCWQIHKSGKLDYLPLFFLFGIGVLLSHTPQLAFLLVPLLLVLRSCFDHKKLNQLAIPFVLFLAIFALLFYFLGSTYFGQGAYSKYGGGNSFSLVFPSITEKTASAFLGGKIMGLDLIILLFACFLALIATEKMLKKDNGFHHFMLLSLAIPLAFSLGLFSAFQLYQIEARWLIAFLLLPFIPLLIASISTFLPIIKKGSVLVALFVVLFLGHANLGNSASSPSIVMAPAFYNLLSELGNHTAADSTILSISILPSVLSQGDEELFVLQQQGATGFSGRRTAETFLQPQLETQINSTRVSALENCFAGFRREGFTFVEESCPEVEQNICNYDYVFIPTVGGFGSGDLPRLLAAKAERVDQLSYGLLFKIKKGTRCV